MTPEMDDTRRWMTQEKGWRSMRNDAGLEGAGGELQPRPGERGNWGEGKLRRGEFVIRTKKR